MADIVGGFKVGVTRSGKEVFAVYASHALKDFLRKKHLGFSYSDYFDAYSIFEFLALRSYRNPAGKVEEADLYLELTALIRSVFLFDEDFNKAMVEIGANSSIDIAKHGASLASPEFQNL